VRSFIGMCRATLDDDLECVHTVTVSALPILVAAADPVMARKAEKAHRRPCTMTVTLCAAVTARGPARNRQAKSIDVMGEGAPVATASKECDVLPSAQYERLIATPVA
jgi:hypothetical protein